jgi:hypothetical protein
LPKQKLAFFFGEFSPQVARIESQHVTHGEKSAKSAYFNKRKSEEITIFQEVSRLQKYSRILKIFYVP